VQATVFIATSLDGFIARENGDIDWLPAMEGPGGEDYGYHGFMETVDVLVMGRHSYEKVRTLGPWFYGKKPVVVLTSGPLDIPPDLADTVESMGGDPREIIARLHERGARHLYVDGGLTIQRFLAANAIQRIIITRIPVLIGSGIPLFGKLPRDVRLQHLQTRAWPNGLVQSQYTVMDGVPSS